MFRRFARSPRGADRRCLHCGTPIRLVDGHAEKLEFCSASCVWDSERLRAATERTVRALRAELARTERERRWRRRRDRTSVDAGTPTDHAAVVVAMRAAGATVWQVARYTGLRTSEVDRILARHAADSSSRRLRVVA